VPKVFLNVSRTQVINPLDLRERERERREKRKEKEEMYQLCCN
jgi:hypothetical protein